MLNDIEIAQQAEMKNIKEVAAKLEKQKSKRSPECLQISVK